MRFEIEAKVSDWIDSIIEADNREDAVEKFKEETKEVVGQPFLEIVSINGIAVIGRCEIDGNYILDGEKTGPYPDVMLCHKCINDGETP